MLAGVGDVQAFVPQSPAPSPQPLFFHISPCDPSLVSLLLVQAQPHIAS